MLLFKDTSKSTERQMSIPYVIYISIKFPVNDLILRISSNMPTCVNRINLNTIFSSLKGPVGTALLSPHYNFIYYLKMYPDNCEDSLT